MDTLQYCGVYLNVVYMSMYNNVVYMWMNTFTWISHGCTCVPHPDPPSHLPPHPIPQGHPSAPSLSTLPHASNLDWRSISHMIIYIFQRYSLKSSHTCLLPQSPKVCSLRLCKERILKTPQHTYERTSLVVQWLRIYLPMQGTLIQSLVLEDSTYCRATKPWAITTESML